MAKPSHIVDIAMPSVFELRRPDDAGIVTHEVRAEATSGLPAATS